MDQSTHFINCKDLDEARALFRKLAQKLHPDHDGNQADFVAMVDEFQRLQKFTWDNAGQAKWGAGYQSTKDFVLSKEAMERLLAVLRYPDLITEIIGTWVWVTGETRKYKDQLKELNFKWSPKKLAWNYHSEPWRKTYRYNYSMDEIRNMHRTQMWEQEMDSQVA